jgi:hypothetical protein
MTVPRKWELAPSFSTQLIFLVSSKVSSRHHIQLARVYHNKMTAIEDHDWKFTQCFGDKSDSGDVTDGMYEVYLKPSLHPGSSYYARGQTIVFDARLRSTAIL